MGSLYKDMKHQLKIQPILKSIFSSSAKEECIRKLTYSYPSLFSIKCPLPSEPPRKLKITGVSGLSLLQGIFPTQQLNRGLALQAYSLPAELPVRAKCPKDIYYTACILSSKIK